MDVKIGGNGSRTLFSLHALCCPIVNHAEGAVPDGKEMTNSHICETCIWHDTEKSVRESSEWTLRYREDSVDVANTKLLSQHVSLERLLPLHL
jgi:hypothetical protein